MFRLEWTQSAVAEMLRAWSLADPALRQRIMAAIGEIDQRLQANPFGEGESRDRGRRILFVVPLGLTYRVEEDGETVSVLHVWTFHTND